MTTADRALNRNVPNLVQASGHKEILRLQRDAILAHGKMRGRPLSILEAGCGQRWLIDLSGCQYTLTGVDIDKAALELRVNKSKDLDVAILGDVTSIDLPAASFDVVYSCYVLEHISQADVAIVNFIHWLKPGGLLIMRMPDRNSARGFLTRMLPHWVHVWYFKYLMGSKMAGKPGYIPYPTCFHPVIERERLCRFLFERDVNCLGCYGDGFLREHSNPIIYAIMKGILKLTSIFSLGRLRADHSNVLYIAEKAISA